MPVNISSVVCKACHVKVFLLSLFVLLLGAIDSQADPAPTNDICVNAVPLVDNVYASEDTTNATDDSVPSLGTISKGVWFSYTPAASGLLTVDTCPSDFDTLVEVVAGCGSPVSLATNDDGGDCANFGASSVSFSVSSNSTYYICAGGFGGDFGNLQIRAHLVALPVITNGQTVFTTFISSGQTQSWVFAGNAGDSVVVRGGSIFVRVELDVAEVGSAFSLPDQVGLVYGRLKTSGAHTVSVQNGSTGDSGQIKVTLAKIPAEPPGSVGTALTNGMGSRLGIGFAEQGVAQFTASAGDSVQLRVTADSILPQAEIYDLEGNLVGDYFPQSGQGSQYFLQITNSGIHTVVIGDYPGDQNISAAHCDISLAKVPGPFLIAVGHSGGVLTNGTINSASIAEPDQNMWSFSGNAGDNLQLHVASVGFTPRIDLYGPNGELAGRYAVDATNFNLTLNCQLTNSGTYVAVISSYFFGGQGTYQLTASGISAPPGIKLGAAVTSGTNLSLSASGGGSNQTFVILSSTNLTLPIGLWTPFLTNQFDGSGNATTSNLLDPSQPFQYFRLSVP